MTRKYGSEEQVRRAARAQLPAAPLPLPSAPSVGRAAIDAATDVIGARCRHRRDRARLARNTFALITARTHRRSRFSSRVDVLAQPVVAVLCVVDATRS